MYFVSDVFTVVPTTNNPLYDVLYVKTKQGTFVSCLVELITNGVVYFWYKRVLYQASLCNVFNNVIAEDDIETF